MATLVLIQGPAGSGKSQLAAEMQEFGEFRVYSDITSLWAALCGAVRGPDGKYPERQDDDPCLEIARYLQTVAARRALQDGVDVGVTTSRRGQELRWQQLADEAGGSFSVRTVDPGRRVVEARLSDDDGQLSAACDRAIRRWYD